MEHADLLSGARYLIDRHTGKPKQADLKRAHSAIYYALFHVLAKNCADMLIGGKGADRSPAAWRQTYRALDHGAAKSQCDATQVMILFPKNVQDFGNAFRSMQSKRHAADYDPLHRLTKSEVLNDLLTAKAVITDFLKVPPKDRRAFAAWVIFKKPRS